VAPLRLSPYFDAPPFDMGCLRTTSHDRSATESEHAWILNTERPPRRVTGAVCCERMDGASRMRENYVSLRELRGSARVAHYPAGCSKRSSSKAVTYYHFTRGGWDDPNCARPTRAFLSRALREHGRSSQLPRLIFQHPAEDGQRLMTISRATLPLGPKGF
jgi:hypothetical protein